MQCAVPVLLRDFSSTGHKALWGWDGFFHQAGKWRTRNMWPAQKPRHLLHHLKAPSRPVGNGCCLRSATLPPVRPGKAPREETWLKDSLKKTNKWWEETSAKVICKWFLVLVKLETHYLSAQACTGWKTMLLGVQDRSIFASIPQPERSHISINNSLPLSSPGLSGSG